MSHLTIVADPTEAIRVEVPVPNSEAEHKVARSLGRVINPANKDPRGWDESFTFPPDSSLIDPLFALARALWAGEAAAIEIPSPTTAQERQVLEELAQQIDPDNNLDLHDTGIGAALADLTYHVRAVLKGTSPNATRCHAVLENALFGVYSLCNVDRDDDKPLMWLYSAALLDGKVKRGEIMAMRDKFRRAVKDAERALDLADAQLARQEVSS